MDTESLKILSSAQNNPQQFQTRDARGTAKDGTEPETCIDNPYTANERVWDVKGHCSRITKDEWQVDPSNIISGLEPSVLIL